MTLIFVKLLVTLKVARFSATLIVMLGLSTLSSTVIAFHPFYGVLRHFFVHRGLLTFSRALVSGSDLDSGSLERHAFY